jgi:hypothetical protein
MGYVFWMWNIALTNLLVGGFIHYHYLLHTNCKIISHITQPYKDYEPKFKLDFVEFETLTFGTLILIVVGNKGV